MRYVAAAILMVFGMEAAALACSCMPPPATASEAQRVVGEAARNVVAVVEADVVQGYDRQRQRGEWVQVRAVLAGQAAPAFRVHRRGEPNSAACGLALQAGQRVMLMLYAVPAARQGEPVFAIQNLCIDPWVRDPQLRPLLVAAVARNPAEAQPAGASRSSRPCEPRAPSSST